MKKLKRYQYERYAILCLESYPSTFDHQLYGFAKYGRQDIADREGKTIIRVLWGESGDAVVVFRGSNSLKDWLINFALIPKKIPMSTQRRTYGFVHWGFHYLLNQPSHAPNLSYQSQPTSMPDTQVLEYLQSQERELLGEETVYKHLINVLAPIIQSGRKVSFTGHSSGGSMAVIAAELMQESYPNAIKRVVTFGQPATGFWSFKQGYSLEKITYRISCDIDIVTFLPAIPFLYWHVGKLLWLHNGRIYENIGTPLRLYLSLRSWLFRPIAYHYMEKYIRRKNYFDRH